MIKPVLVIHGGAGAISWAKTTPEVRQRYEGALAEILKSAGAMLEQGATALDVVTEAVRLLEECPLFNAGYGAVFTSEGKHEMDASIMNGATLDSGAIANVTTIWNPVLAAYDVSAQMEYGGRSLSEAAANVIHEKLPKVEGSGGLIAVDAQGQVAMPFNTDGMYRGYIHAGQAPVVAIHAGDTTEDSDIPDDFLNVDERKQDFCDRDPFG